MATDKSGYVSVGAQIEDKVMPDRVIFSIGFGGRFDTKEACLDDYNADRAKVAAALAPFGLDDELACRRYTCYAQATRKRQSSWATTTMRTARLPRLSIRLTLRLCGRRSTPVARVPI